jgi:hypothetical protein
VTESIFLNIITNGLYTSEYYIVLAADVGGTLKSAYEEMKKISAILGAYTK